MTRLGRQGARAASPRHVRRHGTPVAPPADHACAWGSCPQWASFAFDVVDQDAGQAYRVVNETTGDPVRGCHRHTPDMLRRIAGATTGHARAVPLYAAAMNPTTTRPDPVEHPHRGAGSVADRPAHAGASPRP